MRTIIIVLSLISFGYSEPIGQVKSVEGTVTVTRRDEVFNIDPGHLLESGDVIKTGIGGTCSIILTDASRFALGGNSSLQLKQFTWDSTTHEGESSSFIEKGTVVVSTSPRKGMNIFTPSTKIDIGGTTVAIFVRGY